MIFHQMKCVLDFPRHYQELSGVVNVFGYLSGSSRRLQRYSLQCRRKRAVTTSQVFNAPSFVLRRRCHSINFHYDSAKSRLDVLVILRIQSDASATIFHDSLFQDFDL